MKDSIMFSINSWPILIPIFLLAVLIITLSPRIKNHKYTTLQYTLIITFVIYLLGVIYFTTFPIDVNIGIYANQIPWYETIDFIPILTIDLKTFILNIIMLIPLGMYLPLINGKFNSVKRITKIGFLFSLSIELVQLILKATVGNGRSTDINDLIANTLGAALGYIIINKILKIELWRNMLDKFKL